MKGTIERKKVREEEIQREREREGEREREKGKGKEAHNIIYSFAALKVEAAIKKWSLLRQPQRQQQQQQHNQQQLQ